jgi:hypothetical protein
MQTTLPFPQAHSQAGSKRSQRRWLRWMLIPLVVALIAGGLWWRTSQSTTAVTTTTAAVTQGDLAVTVSGSGTTAAARTVAVPFQQAGTVTSVAVAVGDKVVAGQTLATIDDSALTLALEQAQANLTSAQAQLAKAQNGDATEQDIASAQATPATATVPASTVRVGTSIRDAILMGPLADQPSGVHENRDSEILQRSRAGSGLGTDDIAHPADDGREVDLHLRDDDTEAFRVASHGGDLRATQHHLRGHTPVVVALAPELVLLGKADSQTVLPAQAKCDLRAGAAAAIRVASRLSSNAWVIQRQPETRTKNNMDLLPFL